MKLFLKYLKCKMKTVMLLLIFAVIFLCVFYLYEVPLSAVWYPVLLCFVVGAVYIVADFLSVRKKYLRIEKIICETTEIVEHLPETGDILYTAAASVVEKFKEENLKLDSSWREEYLNTVEYYTVWAHQIKTPISAMRLLLQDEDTRLSRDLKTELARIERYANMVLLYLKLNDGSMDYVVKDEDADRLIKISVRKFSSEFIGRKLTLDYNPVGITLKTDEKWFCFVLEQLLSNALKYTRTGGIKIYADGETLVIEDSGIGIAPEDLPRVFEKGYTGYNGRFDKTASGVGLYLCRKICDNLGIGISVSSEVDKGTAVKMDMHKIITKM